jgi:hypothetical protein
MFEEICIRRQERGNDQAFDLGLLAEAMLFYDNVRIVCDIGMLEQLTKQLGPDLLLEFLDSGYLKITYLENNIAVRTFNDTSMEQHELITFSAPDFALDHFAPKLFSEVTGKSGKGRRMAKRFQSFVQTYKYHNSVLQDTLNDLTDSHYTTNAASIILATLAPEYKQSNNFTFEVNRTNDKLSIDTTIDFLEANRIYRKYFPPSHSTLAPSYLLSYMLTAKEDLHFSSLYSSELATDKIHAALFEFRLNTMFNSRSRSEDQISVFQDFVLDEAHAIRETINSGERNFKDVLALLTSARKFRQWVKGQTPDINLAKAYFQEVNHLSWIDKLPGKSLRWLFFTGVGVGIDFLGAGGIGTTAGLLASAGDAFVLDKLIKGWKPHQFVEGPLKKFTNKK